MAVRIRGVIACLTMLGINLPVVYADDLEEMGASCGRYTVSACNQHKKVHGSQELELQACQEMFAARELFCESFSRGDSKKKQQSKLNRYRDLASKYTTTSSAELQRRLGKPSGKNGEKTRQSGTQTTEFGKPVMSAQTRKYIQKYCGGKKDLNYCMKLEKSTQPHYQGNYTFYYTHLVNRCGVHVNLFLNVRSEFRSDGNDFRAFTDMYPDNELGMAEFNYDHGRMPAFYATWYACAAR